MEDSTHIDPTLQRLIEWSCMSFVVHHDIRLKTHVPKRIYAFKLLLWSRIVVREDKHLRPVSFVELALEMFCKALQTFENLVFLFVVVPCKVNCAESYLVQHFHLLGSEQSCVHALVDIYLCFAVS